MNNKKKLSASADLILTAIIISPWFQVLNQLEFTLRLYNIIS